MNMEKKVLVIKKTRIAIFISFNKTKISMIDMQYPLTYGQEYYMLKIRSVINA